MNEFKIGDRVKIVDSSNSAYEGGDVGYIIEDPDNYADNVTSFCVKGSEYDYEQVFEAYQLEPADE